MNKTMIFGCLLAAVLLAGCEASTQEPAAAPVALPSGASSELASLTGSGVWQLRIYTINRGRLDDFVAAWREGVYPVRVQHGFQIPAAWVIRENNQFVWILGYEGSRDDWDAKQAAYYSSAERTGLAVDPLQFIAHGESWFITDVLAER